MMLRTEHLLLATGLLLTACNDSPIAPFVPASVEITGGEPTLLFGDELTLDAVVRDASGKMIGNAGVSWSSDWPDHASVDSMGVVRGLGIGDATIEARLDSVSATYRIAVVPRTVTRVVIEPDTLILSVGALRPVTVTAFDDRGLPITYASPSLSFSDGVVARPDAGRVLGLEPGITILRADLDGMSDTATVTVVDEPVRLIPDLVTLVPDQQRQINAYRFTSLGGRTPIATDIEWTTSNPSVVTVSAEGVLTSRSPGTALVTANGGGSTAQVEVRVHAYERPISFSALSNTCGLDRDGRVFCWGAGPPGVAEVWEHCVNVGATGYRDRRYYWEELPCSSIPAKVETTVRFDSIWQSGGSFTSGGHVCALTAAGEAYCWGENFHGGVGNGTTVDAPRPTAVLGGLRFRQLAVDGSRSCGLTPDDRAYCWGDGLRLTPELVSTELRFSTISTGGSHTCAVDLDGMAYCWGLNHLGQLGTGPTGEICGRVECSTLPRRVQTEERFVTLSAGSTFVCGLTDRGQAFCWGSVYEGYDDMGSIAPRAVPGDRRYSTLDTYDGGDVCFLDEEGALWCWSGRLPFSQTPRASYPDFRFQAISAGRIHACGIATDALAYCFGYDDARLGSGGIPAGSDKPVLIAGQR